MPTSVHAHALDRASDRPALTAEQAKRSIDDARHALLPLALAADASCLRARDGVSHAGALETPATSPDRGEIAMQLTSLVTDVGRILDLLLAELALAGADDDLRRRLVAIQHGLEGARGAWMT